MIISKQIIRDPYEYEMTQVRKQRLWGDMLKYLIPAIREKVFGRHLTEAELREFEDLMIIGFEYYRVYKPELSNIDFFRFMQRLMPIIRSHRAFALFVRDKRGEISPTYVPWALNVLDKESGVHYGKALMMALGEGEDITGKPCDVTCEDPHYFEHVTTGWGYIEARHRSVVARKCLAKSRDALILGAGYLPELSPKFGGELHSGLRVIACDTDSSISAAEIKAKYPELNIDYRHEDMLKVLRDCRSQNLRFDTIIMDGVLYYNLDHVDEIFELCMACLRRNGHLVFDMLILHPELINLRAVLDWGAESDHPMKLMLTQRAARRFVKKHCRRWPNLKIESSTAGLYRHTSALTFLITKP